MEWLGGIRLILTGESFALLTRPLFRFNGWSSSKFCDLIRPVDILMIPVGGFYTIDAETAKRVVQDLAPKVVIPMHFKTAILEEGFPIEGVDPFLAGYDNVHKPKSSSIHLRADQLPDELTIEVLEYHGQK